MVAALISAVEEYGAERILARCGLYESAIWQNMRLKQDSTTDLGAADGVIAFKLIATATKVA